MRTSFILILLTILFNACSSHNAFEKFNISKTKELSEDSIQSAKIKKGDSVDGIVSVVYLNKVLPNLYKDNEYFYVYYYIKDKNATSQFLLNGKQSLLREELSANNEFSNLTAFDAPWSKYYLVGFKKEGNVLNFTIQTSKEASATLQFIKDK